MLERTDVVVVLIEGLIKTAENDDGNGGKSIRLITQDKKSHVNV